MVVLAQPNGNAGWQSLSQRGQLACMRFQILVDRLAQSLCQTVQDGRPTRQQVRAQGDDSLRKIGQALMAAKRRPLDLLARYGGEEFVCVLPETHLAGAVAVAESLRAAVAGLAIEHAHPSAAGHITMSLGVAGCIPSENTTSADLLSGADKALYQAKREGRDRVRAG